MHKLLKTIIGRILFFVWLLFALVSSISIGILFITLSYVLPASFLRSTLLVFWGKLLIYGSLSSIKIYDTHKILSEPSIIVSNHQSMMDIFVATGFFKKDFVFLSKAEVFSIPIVGGTMSRSGFLPVDRKSPRKAAQSVIEMIKSIQEGNSILIYPEGTRNAKNDQMLPFKVGALTVGIKAKVPILPIVVYDTKQIYSEEKKFFIWPKRLKIKILDPIGLDDKIHPANESSKMSVQEKLDHLRGTMQTTFDEFKRVTK